MTHMLYFKIYLTFTSNKQLQTKFAVYTAPPNSQPR